jgi:hypothetical protein
MISPASLFTRSPYRPLAHLSNRSQMSEEQPRPSRGHCTSEAARTSYPALAPHPLPVALKYLGMRVQELPLKLERASEARMLADLLAAHPTVKHHRVPLPGCRGSSTRGRRWTRRNSCACARALRRRSCRRRHAEFALSMDDHCRVPLAIVYVWCCALTGRRDSRLRVAVAALVTEGAFVTGNGGDSPLGGLQDRLGDPVPLFELMLSPRPARYAGVPGAGGEVNGHF